MSGEFTSGLGSANQPPKITVPKSLGDAATVLRELSEPRRPDDHIKDLIARAARLAGLSFTRVFDLWYGKARRLEDAERFAIAEALAAKREREARNELHDVKMRLTRLEALLAQELANRQSQSAREMGSPADSPGGAGCALAHTCGARR